MIDEETKDFIELAAALTALGELSFRMVRRIRKEIDEKKKPRNRLRRRNRRR